MYLPSGYHEVFIGYWAPGFVYKVVIWVNGSADVEVFARGFSIYAGVSAPAPVEISFSVMYFPLVPLAVLIYLLLSREKVAEKLAAALAPLYTRFIRPAEVLTNAKRRSIYDYIRERGYSWPRELEKIFNMAYGEVCWHLSLLERAGLIYNFYALRRRFYVDRQLPLEDAVNKIFRDQAGRPPTEEEVLQIRESLRFLLPF
ncbi:winged helix-turn-helix domain-containing protein [Pyrobaculum ferrireducens]|uniref:Transcriptional regulator, ArsR family n=1 Tax=Pyrobaculum ferrireducens TaxID=1104324 RepID=G7VH80_9CREN|nr:winged helix-turn-helix domain-containing protein [Pyrobaculum ferrireducens]AET31983.1 hypothetical protein P186_0531 [Pyrobaculum ferrireducens]